MVDRHVWLSIALIAAVTAALRFAPFLLLGNRKPPKAVVALGNVLPYAVMGMLVVYCLKDVSLTQTPHGLPELISILVVGVLYIWRRNTLLSIVCGTACYMALVQLVFQ